MKVLFLNHKKRQCGVYQYGMRLYDILLKTKDIQYIYEEVEIIEDYRCVLSNHSDIDLIIYNYCGATMNYLNRDTIQKNVKNLCILHESADISFFDFHINICSLEDYVPRPIFENIESILNKPIHNSFITQYTDTNIPIFGSFGFGFDNKGFGRLVKMVNDQYDNAVIKLLIPSADFGPKREEMTYLIQNCQSQISKSGIQLIVSHDFLTNEEVLQFLNSNTMNLFLYDELAERQGFSSVIDYVLSLNKPFGISNSHMFRHIYDDSVCVYNNSIETCRIQSINYLQKIKEQNTNEKLISKFQNICKRNTKFVLFLNHKLKQCGVYQYGKRVYDIIKETPYIQYVYREVDNYEEYQYYIKEFQYYCIFYNYHCITMPWLNENNIQKNIKNIGTQHDLEEYPFFDSVARLDCTLIEQKHKYSLPRPLFYKNIEDYSSTNERFKNFIYFKPENPNIPIIGSFGFGSFYKGFDKIVKLVNEQYEQAIIKFLIPSADYGSKHEQNIQLINYCSSFITKPGILILYFQEFVENEEMLLFLNSNTINLFLYEDAEKNGLSSTIDYAISARKPFGISNSSWFRHIYSDEICVNKTSLDEIIKKGTFFCGKYLERFSSVNLINKMKQIITEV